MIASKVRNGISKMLSFIAQCLDWYWHSFEDQKPQIEEGHDFKVYVSRVPSIVDGTNMSVKSAIFVHNWQFVTAHI